MWREALASCCATLKGRTAKFGGETVPEEKHWEEGMKTHENIIFSCYGGMSNTGITSALACLEAVKELGLEKVAIGCLGHCRSG